MAGTGLQNPFQGNPGGALDGGTDFYKTTLEPMQMLQAYRAGQPVTNHVWQPAQQFLPQALPTYTPPPAIVQAPRTWGLGGNPGNGNGAFYGNPGPGVGATDGQDGAAAAAEDAAVSDAVSAATATGDGGGGSK